MSERPVLLKKSCGGDLWVLRRDVLRVEDYHAMDPRYSTTRIYFRDGTERYLPPLTASEAIATLWPEPTD